MTQIGLQKDDSILRSPPQYLRLSGRHAAARRELIAAVEGSQAQADDGSGIAGAMKQKGARMTTKRALDAQPGSHLDFDVVFTDLGEIGARLEERGGMTPVSVVVNVVENSQAAAKGVTIGCTVVGINGEKFLSHAHTVSTLKHARRPVTVRFRRLER